MKNENHTEQPASRGLLPTRKAVIAIGAIGACALLLYGMQDLILRRVGYTGRLYDPPATAMQISGSVRDAETGENIEGAKVAVDIYGISCVTDMEGEFNLTLPVTTDGTVLSVTVDKDGYISSALEWSPSGPDHESTVILLSKPSLTSEDQ